MAPEKTAAEHQNLTKDKHPKPLKAFTASRPAKALLASLLRVNLTPNTVDLFNDEVPLGVRKKMVLTNSVSWAIQRLSSAFVAAWNRSKKSREIRAEPG